MLGRDSERTGDDEGIVGLYHFDNIVRGSFALLENGVGRCPPVVGCLTSVWFVFGTCGGRSRR